jgi:beta-galactosidase
VWREVVELGASLRAIGEVAGSRPEQAQVALLFDWPSWWAAELDSHPSVDVDPLAEARRWHHALWARNVAVDIVGSGDDLSRYRVVIVPVQYLLDDAGAHALDGFVSGGGTVVVTYFSGIVDECDRVRLGGYPGALRELLGVRIEEFYPLAQGDSVSLSDGSTGRIWSELGRADAAEVLATYADGPTAGSPAITRRGNAYYVGTVLDDVGALLDQVLAAAAVQPVVADLPDGVEAVRRVGANARYLFLMNHTSDEVTVTVEGTDLLTGDALAALAPGGVAVVREG